MDRDKGEPIEAIIQNHDNDHLTIRTMLLSLAGEMPGQTQSRAQRTPDSHRTEQSLPLEKGDTIDSENRRLLVGIATYSREICDCGCD